MLAIAWPRDSGNPTLANRLAASLCAGIGGEAAAREIEGLHFAYRPLNASKAAIRAWRPSILPSGQIAILHGHFDNLSEIALELALDPCDAAMMYGSAVERWGDDADRRIIGEYCSVMIDPQRGMLRLSRSPLRAPPLYYSDDDRQYVVASVPRAIFAAGVAPVLNEARIADALLRNFADDEASAFQGISQVPTGSVVELEAGRSRTLRRWYDVLALPFLEVTDDESVIEKAGELLDEGIRACLTGFKSPGSTLSGGLDSPQVAVRALAAIPPNARLPTFTFHPESGFDGRAPRWMVGDERPYVEALAAMHERLEPHFVDNAGREHDYRSQEMFHLIGDPTATYGTYVFHGLLSAASKAGCDVLLLADWGNLTFSDKGECGFVEYFLKGQWRQLWLALTRPPIHRGSLLRRFTSRCLSALLPNAQWRFLRRLLLRRDLLAEHAQPLAATYRSASGADERLKKAGEIADRYQPWNRRHSRRLLIGRGDPAPFHQGLEQMYGVALRDPTAYRPFVEFCLGLPTRMFMRDGETRWLAKQMAKGLMPEKQRSNRLNGWWDADWHIRIGRRRRDWLAELEQMQSAPRLGQMFDVPRLKNALEDWPDRTETDPAKAFAAQLAVPTAILTARFINYVEGRNDI